VPARSKQSALSHVVCGIVVISTFSASLNAAQVAVVPTPPKPTLKSRLNVHKARHNLIVSDDFSCHHVLLVVGSEINLKSQ